MAKKLFAVSNLITNIDIYKIKWITMIYNIHALVTYIVFMI